VTRPKIALAHRPELDGDAQPTLWELEREHVIDRLERFSGNMSATAQSLGIDRRTLYRKSVEYRIKGMIEGYRRQPVDVQEVE
jgi:DNA-binding NtrC family response regulator